MAVKLNTFNFDEEEKIVKINFKTSWNWNTHNDKCPICRNYIFEPSLNNDNNNKNCCSKAQIGVCGHAFHSDCISNWTRTRNVCPLCNVKWQPLKNS